MKAAGVHGDESAALEGLKARQREDAKNPVVEERLILEVLPNRVIRWQDEHGEHHMTRLRDRLRTL